MLTWYLGVILKEVGTNLNLTLPIAYDFYCHFNINMRHFSKYYLRRSLVTDFEWLRSIFCSAILDLGMR